MLSGNTSFKSVEYSNLLVIANDDSIVEDWCYSMGPDLRVILRDTAVAKAPRLKVNYVIKDQAQAFYGPNLIKFNERNKL